MCLYCFCLIKESIIICLVIIEAFMKTKFLINHTGICMEDYICFKSRKMLDIHYFTLIFMFEYSLFDGTVASHYDEKVFQ